MLIINYNVSSFSTKGKAKGKAHRHYSDEPLLLFVILLRTIYP